MIYADLIAWFQQYHEWILSAAGGLAGWYGNLAKNRLQRQRNVIDAEQLENEQLALALNRERFLTDRLTVQGQEAEMLWRRLYDRESVIKEYHSAALSAQRQVNELEIRAGLSATVFPDLPDFPPEDEGSKMAEARSALNERGERSDDGNKTGRSLPGGQGDFQRF